MHIVRMIWVLLAAMLIVSCGGGGGGGGGIAASSSTVGVVLTDNPVAGYDKALATISCIKLIPAESNDSSSHVVIFDGPPTTVDLLALRDYQELFAINDDVPPGEYSKIRLCLDELELIKVDDMGTEIESLQVRLVAGGKVDLNPRGTFDVGPGEKLFITLDFDMEKSIKLTLAGKKKNPKLRPVIFVKISDREPMGRIARIRGIIDAIDTATNRLRLCEVERVAQVSIATYDDQLDACVTITTGEKTVAFGEDGTPIGLSALMVGDPVTIIGRLVMLDPPAGPVAQTLTLGKDKDKWKGDWDWDHDWDSDHDWDDCPDWLASINGCDDDDDKDDDKDDDNCVAAQSVSATGKKDKDCDDDDDSDDSPTSDAFGFAALLIERGVPGTFRIWHGATDSDLDDGTDQFDLALDAGQGFTEGAVLPTQLYPETWIVSKNGGLLDREAIVAGLDAAVDGVIDFMDSVLELRAALVVIDEDSGPGPGPDPGEDSIEGEIVGVDTVGGIITAMNEIGQFCIDANGADIMLVADPGAGEVVETTYTDFDIFGPTGTAINFEARYGDGMVGGGWEIGALEGVVLDQSAQADWTNGVAKNFTLTHDSATGELTFNVDGTALTWSLTPGEGYGKISILAKSAATAGFETVIDNLQIDGMPLTNGTLTAGPSEKSGVNLTGKLYSDFTVTGTVTLSWGATPPNSASLQMFIGVAEGDVSIENGPGTIEDLEAGQQIVAFGTAGDAECFQADSIVATIE